MLKGVQGSRAALGRRKLSTRWLIGRYTVELVGSVQGLIECLLYPVMAQTVGLSVGAVQNTLVHKFDQYEQAILLEHVYFSLKLYSFYEIYFVKSLQISLA